MTWPTSAAAQAPVAPPAAGEGHIPALLGAICRRAEGDDNAPPGLANHLPDLRAVRVWEGSWDTLESASQVSLRTPAALVSLIDFEVVSLGTAVAGADALKAAGPGDALSPAPPIRLRPQPSARAIVAAEIAVTVLAADPDAGKRAAAALDIAERALPVLAWHGLTGLAGTNLDTPALRKRGLSAVAIVGRRELDLSPARQAPPCPSLVEIAGREVSVV